MTKFITDTAVLIPHYNNLPGLEASLASLAASTLHVPALIIDDGSSPAPSLEKLRALYPHTDLILLEKNQGIVAAMNAGIKQLLSRDGLRFIARLDAEDTLTPDRLRIQHHFLMENPQIYVLGSWVRFCDPSGSLLWNYCPPAGSDAIRKRMFVNNMFCHPAVMCRREVFEQFGLYSRRFPSAEDYDLFFRVTRSCPCANIPQYLLTSIVNPEGITIRKRRTQLKSRFGIILRHFDFSPWAFYGLLRNLLLCLVPYGLLRSIKSHLKQIR